jgi:hypothetical protein
MAALRRPASSDGVRRTGEGGVAVTPSHAVRPSGYHAAGTAVTHDAPGAASHVRTAHFRSPVTGVARDAAGVTGVPSHIVRAANYRPSNHGHDPDVVKSRPRSTRPLCKVKSDTCLPPVHAASQPLRHARPLRHRVTVNAITMTSHSGASGMAPLADIDEHSPDLDFRRVNLRQVLGF